MKTLRKAACLLMASAMVAACSNNSSDKSPTSSTTSLARPPASRAWKAVEDDPCRLLTKADVESIFDKQSVELVEVPPARSCRYRLDETTTISVDLFRPMAKATIAARTSGTTTGPIKESYSLRLTTLGAGVYLVNGTGVALLSVRPDGGSNEPEATAVTELASRIDGRLPEGPEPYERDPDLCAVVTTKVLGLSTELDGGDPQDAQTCAYRSNDGTLFTITANKKPVPAVPLTKTWKSVGQGATMDSSSFGEAGGGSFTAMVPFGEGAIQISASSPTLSVKDLEAASARAAKLVLKGS